MKSKTVSLIFILVAFFLAGVFFITRGVIVEKEDDSASRSKVITPVANDSELSQSENPDSGIEGEAYETFVPLNSGETLISTYVMDINNDGYDDEVIAVRSTSSPFLSLVPALINPDTGVYTRLDPIVTEFTNTRTFSYSGIDVIGKHKNSLIYQGVDASGDYVMEIFLYKETRNKKSKRGKRGSGESGTTGGKSGVVTSTSGAGGVSAASGVVSAGLVSDDLFVSGELVSIGSFACDGTIFIQQLERSESYEMSLSDGESFSVWVYKSENYKSGQKDDNNGRNGENQIQQEFKWNPKTEHYELAREIKVTANRLAARELSRIQDGTVGTFASFLDGLWYKTSNVDGNIRYIYFDYEAKEIILLKEDTEEVYLWEDSKLRHNGMYVTAINADITNLRRRFNMGLVNVDEIYISLQDYINLLIKENNMWDGNYKKMNLQSSLFYKEEEVSPIIAYNTELVKGPAWISADMTSRLSFSDYSYKFEEKNLVEYGIYTTMPVGEHNVIQFRSDKEESLLKENYSMKFGTKTITETSRRKTEEKIVPDYDTIILSPVNISYNDCFPVEGRVFTFNREKLPEEVTEDIQDTED